MKPTTVDEYFEQVKEERLEKLSELRFILKNIVPNAIEVIKWGKPVFKSETILFAYSAHKSHLSFIPTGPALKPFQKELEPYKVNKDSVQFLYSNPLPVELIQKIAKYRKNDVEINQAKWKY
ncbi:Uncharacterized conserved protein YdhG, YjbR/CyaY-like superfamily, DUF1801 family [Maribacter orientalis]|uniref:Uncharacterized conserved protein YdhG, YjbR/CyaY-like superfamily, DUF1801 family n=1 Tax=Maribacter orientalis TaxID=228957 RepID=A0A1H7NEL4_9FLAO|nr:DUF1801 domain-containing protein [Maribacter orientalis]SEL22012.1 Uncharacterized conserved protein YdhG, YjbR/CyaY-like superfamily, DUF1801 family [Maribacter orientalis]|tara:strand:+ start:601 stop:966 length:366 start_codon:yes stop_codon:yes gene_type:complete